MAESVNIEISIDAKDNTSAGVSSAQKRLTSLEKSIEKTEKMLQKLERGSFTIDVSISDNASDKIANIDDAVNRTNGMTAHVSIRADDGATGPLSDVKDRVSEVNGSSAVTDVSADDAATPVIRDVQDNLASLNGSQATVNIDAKNNTGLFGLGGGNFSLPDIKAPGMPSLSGGMSSAKGALVGAAGFAGLSLGAGSAVNSFMGFEAGMSQVAAISGATGAELDQLTEKAKQMGATTKFTATESATAFNYMAMAGWKTEDMMAGIDGVMNLAAASGEDLGTVSDIVTDSMTAFGMSASGFTKNGVSNVTHFADVLAQASANANTNVSMMGESFKYIAPLAGAMGYTIEDTALALGLMANAGVKSSMAGTSLRRAISSLTSPTDEQAKAMKDYGISLTEEGGGMKSLNEVMTDLRTNLGGLSEEEQTAAISTMFGTEAMSGMLAIINASEDDWNKLSEAVNNADGASKQMADTMMNNLKGSMTLLSSAFEGVQNTLGERLAPYIRGIVDDLTDVMPQISDAINSAFDGIDEAFSLEGMSGVAEEIGNIIGDISTTIGEKGQEAIQGAGEFMSSLLSSLSSTENSDKIAGAAASILTELGTQIPNVTADFSVAALSIIESLTTSLTNQDAGTKIADAVTNALSDVGNWFGENGGDFGTAAGELVSQLASGIGENADALIGAGIKIVGGLAQGLVQGAGVLIGQAPSIILDLIGGILQNIPALFQAGIELVTALKDGIISAGEGIGDLFNEMMTIEPIELNAEINYDNLSPEIMSELQGSMSELNSSYSTLSDDAQEFYASLANGKTTVSAFNEAIQGMDPTDSPFADANVAIAQFISDVNALHEAGILANEATESTASGMEATADAAESSADKVEGAMERVMEASNLETGSGMEGAVEELNQMAEEYTQAGEALEEAFDIDLAESLGGLTGDTLTELLSAEDMNAKAEEINAAMQSVAEGLSTAGTQMSTAVSESMSAMTESLSQGQAAFTSFQEAAISAMTAVQEAMSAGGSAEAGSAGAGAAASAGGGESSGMTVDVSLKPGEIDVAEVNEAIQQKLTEMGADPYPAEGTVDAILTLASDNSAEIYQQVSDNVQSQFSATIPASGSVAVTLAWHITNPTASISVGVSGGSATATIASAGMANGGFVDGAMLSLIGEDGPEYVIPVGGKRRTRGVELWAKAGEALGMFDNVPAYADGGVVGGNEDPMLVNTFTQYKSPLAASKGLLGAVASSKQGSAGTGVNVNVAMSPVIQIDGSNMNEEGIFNVMKNRIREVADDIGDEIGTKLTEIFGNMPLAGEA